MASDREIAVGAVVAGLLFSAGMTVWTGLTDGWGEVSPLWVVFQAVFFAVVWGFLMRVTAAGNRHVVEQSARAEPER